jgi:hypothetical protein
MYHKSLVQRYHAGHSMYLPIRNLANQRPRTAFIEPIDSKGIGLLHLNPRLDGI